MSLLTIIQGACAELGFAQPTAAYASADSQILQMVALLNVEGKELAARYDWQKLTQRTSFVTVGTEIQGSMSTIAPGYKFVINDTIWNSDLRRPVFGPVNPQAWEQFKAMQINGPWNQYRIYGDQIHFFPVPSAGQTCYFEYITRYWVGGTSAAWTQDTDTALLDEDLMQRGLIWRWKKTKGLDYAEDFNTYERQVVDAMARDGGKDTLSADGAKYDIYPVVMLPSGSWMQ